MKIHWLSNAMWAATGYGNQTKVFLPRLKALGHKVSMTAFWGLEGAVLEMDGIKTYPRWAEPYGTDIVMANATLEQADIIISLIDAWVLDSSRMQNDKTKWIPWFPVDSEPLPPPVKRAITGAHKRIVFSHFGERMLDQAGLDHYYVPHGVDTEVFSPRDQKESRKALGLPEDAYIVGMVAANKGNPSRKAFCEQISAFQILKIQHPDAILLMHTYDGAGGHNASVNLAEFIQGLGLVFGKDVFMVNQHQYHLGFDTEYMVRMYSSMDVMMNVSTGEGFGIPIVEAQACGTPVIVGDWTSMSELCFSGRLVDKMDASPWYTAIGAYQFLPKIGAIGSLLLEEYAKPSRRTPARLGALAYDADKVTSQYWMPVLEDIEAHLEKHVKLDPAFVIDTSELKECDHEWLSIGLFTPDGFVGPCKHCNAGYEYKT